MTTEELIRMLRTADPRGSREIKIFDPQMLDGEVGVAHVAQSGNTVELLLSEPVPVQPEPQPLDRTWTAEYRLYVVASGTTAVVANSYARAYDAAKAKVEEQFDNGAFGLIDFSINEVCVEDLKED